MPVVTSLTFDKPAYTPGQLITATIAYDADLVFQATGTGIDIAGQQASLSGSFTVHGKALISDSGNRTWTLVSDDGATAVFTATA